jgi:hypothetical protein
MVYRLRAPAFGVSGIMALVNPLLKCFVAGLAMVPAFWGQSIEIGNDKLTVAVTSPGGRIARVVLREGESLSPIASIGHFLALDGFGAPSEQEQKLGMPFHGEANRQPVHVIASHEGGPVHLITMQSSLPLAQETLTRTLQVTDGESVVYVTSQLESSLAIDRPVSWAEHATIGPPFLERGKTVVDMSAASCRVRPWKAGSIPGHLAYEKDFKWPMAPTNDGGQADLRVVPTDHNWLDLASCQMDPARRLEFVTALQLEKHLLYGYVFRREDYPWLMSWMNFTGDEKAARGMEFSTQPFDVSHRETVAMSPLFGTPTFRWLPAKATIETRFLLFYTRVPDDFTRIDDVVLEHGKLTIVDHSGKRLALAAGKEL